MSFNEKLQKLRKENKYSQEELADKLDVTRQSVSKWESGQTYPEMDKLLALCKIFNCSLEDLTNDEIKEITGERKKDFNTIVDNVLELIDKTYKMFTNMNFKEITGCIVVMLIVAIILTTFRVPINILERSFFNVVNSLGLEVFTNFTTALFNLIIGLTYAVVFILLFVFIFKTMFLDKYEFKEEDIDDALEKTEKSVEKLEKTLEAKPKKITSEKDYTIFKTLGSIIMFFVKIILIVLAIPFVLFLVGLFAALVAKLYLITQGVIFISILLLIIFCIPLTILVLEFIFNILFNKKHRYTKMLIVFIVGFAGLGISFGILLIDINNMTFSETVPTELKFATEKFEFDFKDDMFISYYRGQHRVDFVVDTTLKDQVVIEVDYYKDFINIMVSNYGIPIEVYNTGIHRSKYRNYLDLVITALQDKVIFSSNELYDTNITVYASASNIEKMQQNYLDYLEDQRVSYEETYGRIDSLYIQVSDLERMLEQYKWEKDDLLRQLNEYKERVRSIID